ncbi:MAG: HAMP domain-containing sensor histidine kinase [Myxococcota bacterium]
MSGVSGRVLTLVIEAARRRAVPIARVAAGLEIDVDSLRPSSTRIPWEAFARFLDRLADEIGGPAELRHLSEDQLARDPLGIFRVIGRVLASPRDVYAVGARWMGPSLFPMIRAETWDGTDGVLMQRLTLLPGHRDCPGLFHLMHGALIVLPRAWGHGASEVEIEVAPGRATYTIRPSSIRPGPITRALRAMRSRLAFPTMLRELEEQQRAINSSYQALRDAHGRISAQAVDLERVDSIGRELSKDVDLDRVLDALLQILGTDLGFAGAEIWLAEGADGALDERLEIVPSDAALERVRSTGASEDASSRRYRLEAAGRRLGELVVHHARGDGNADALRLLSLLMPWIALAVDNALTYARLERHAERLEQRVQERTARLLAANHHLVREIDERKRATDALVQSEAQLRASERLASIGTLAAGIAHEINNPIGAILAAAQLAQILRSDPTATAQIDSALDDIVGEARRCGDIVRSVLQFAREERTDKWPCTLRDLLIRSIRMTSRFAEKNGARVVTSLEVDPIRILANPTQIEQALVNLIRNSVESGSTEIQVALVPDVGRGQVAIEVRDDGAGISEADRLRILEPFYTTRRTTGGTGLGLSVVHGIALEHGGTLEIESSLGRGTAIRFCVPMLAPEAEAPAGSDAGARSAETETDTETRAECRVGARAAIDPTTATPVSQRSPA